MCPGETKVHYKLGMKPVPVQWVEPYGMAAVCPTEAAVSHGSPW